MRQRQLWRWGGMGMMAQGTPRSQAEGILETKSRNCPPTTLLPTPKAGPELGLGHPPSSAPPQAESTLWRRPKRPESTKVPWTTHSGREPVRKGQEVWAAPASSRGPKLQGMDTRQEARQPASALCPGLQTPVAKPSRQTWPWALWHPVLAGPHSHPAHQTTSSRSPQPLKVTLKKV